MYSCTLSLTSALCWVGGQRHAPTALPQEKTRYPLYRRLGDYRGRCGRVRKISAHRDSIPGPSSPLASRYADYAPLVYYRGMSHGKLLDQVIKYQLLMGRTPSWGWSAEE